MAADKRKPLAVGHRRTVNGAVVLDLVIWREGKPTPATPQPRGAA